MATASRAMSAPSNLATASAGAQASGARKRLEQPSKRFRSVSKLGSAKLSLDHQRTASTEPASPLDPLAGLHVPRA